MKELTVLEDGVGLRLDQYLPKVLPEMTRATCSKLIAQGLVRIDGVVATKAGLKLKLASVINVDLSPLSASNIQPLDLPVIFEDDDCVVINKPVGVLVHSKGNFNPEATVASWLDPKTTGLTGNRGGIVHRLDRLTSGVMICAKNLESMHWLQKQFSLRKVKKTYFAIVSGQLDKDSALIDIPIERNPKKPQTFKASSNGKTAQTAYQVISVSDKYTLLELKPTTGRTHQLRVHLAHIGHPIVGDPLYNGDKADRMYLHAQKLELTLPSRERKVFEAALPKEFKLKIELNG